MSSMQERERALEELFHLNEEKKFKATIKVIKKLAAETSKALGLSLEDQAAYTAKCLEKHMETGNPEKIIGIMVADLTKTGIEAQEKLMEKRYHEILEETLKAMAQS